MLKKSILLVLIVAVLFPSVTLAMTSSERTYLLSQIQILTKEVLRLQAILASQNKTYSPQVAGDRIYSGRSGSANYIVEAGLIKNGTRNIDTVHQKLFDHFKDVIGHNEAASHIGRFKVEHVFDPKLEDYIEGYVEYIPTDDSWELTVRRDTTKPLTTKELELFTELYIHEYAHVLAYENPDILNDFREDFWTDRQTMSLSAKANRNFDDYGFSVLDEVYKGNFDQFVSGYAMLNADEDFAETFTWFVENDYPVGTDVRSRKIKYFYGQREMISVRDNVRANLGMD